MPSNWVTDPTWDNRPTLIGLPLNGEDKPLVWVQR